MLLAVLDAGGSAEVFLMDPYGSDRLRHVERMLLANPEPKRSELALVAMDRYLQLTLDGDGRMVLPANLISHLDAQSTACARVVVRSRRLWLWSEPLWKERQFRKFEELDAALEEPSGLNLTGDPSR